MKIFNRQYYILIYFNLSIETNILNKFKNYLYKYDNNI